MDTEIMTLNRIYQSIKQFDKETRIRMLRWLISKLHADHKKEDKEI